MGWDVVGIITRGKEERACDVVPCTSVPVLDRELGTCTRTRVP